MNKIREIIGPGGKVIREICEVTGAKIDITDEGQVSISAVGKEKLDAAIAKVKEIAIDPVIGDVFEGTVVKILEAGAFVNYSGSRDGFVHISEIANERIETVASALSEGQKVRVKLIGFDRGKGKLTIKNADVEVVSEKAQQKPKEKPSKKDESIKADSENQEKRESSKKWKNNKSVPVKAKQEEMFKREKELKKETNSIIMMHHLDPS